MDNALSLNAQQMLLSGERVDTVKGMENIKSIFIDEGIPLFPKVIEFQDLYGGIRYKIGPKYYKGFSMGLFYYHDYKKKYQFRYYSKEEDRFFFQCMDYHYAGDIGPCMDEDGKIYYFGMGKYFITADTIEEFLEDEAVKFHMVNDNPEARWLTRGATPDEVLQFRNNVELIRIENKLFSNKYFEWWSDTSENIFIRIDIVNGHNRAAVYCRNKDVLITLFKEDKPASLFIADY
jgi:hypothetical protein